MFLNLFNENSEALNLLDWFQITNDISSLSHFELTQKKLLVPPKFKNENTIQFELDQLEAYLRYFDEFSLFFNSKLRFLPSASEKFSLVAEINKGKYFEAIELNFFALLIESYLDSYTIYKNIPFSKNFELTREEISKLKRNYLNPLRDFIDPSGNVSYERHPLLKKIYADIIQIESELRNSINRIAKSEAFSSKLQLDTYDIINDRFVLAIRSDSYQSELGPIIARSQSGMTLFVEPFEMRDKSNRRMRLLAEIDSIILKLTIDLSKSAHENFSLFEILSAFPLELDWLNTKATYSFKYGLAKPIIAKKFNFELQGLFHPLLKNPIKNHLHLEVHHKGLIISGPNTGGKTVALKSLCLCLLFLNMGLYVPASFAEIYPAEGLYYFSHDHQNLTAGLSSFASESKYYLELLEQLSAHNLIVVDEIFNSTSSEEASALAMAFLDEIHFRSNSKVVISTHHQVLKTFMHSQKNYISAHVGFDFEKNRPTYKLIVGEPGSSLAFKIFENLSSQFGLQTKISERAKDFLDNKQLTYESLLQELSSKKIELDKLITSNRQLNVDLKNQKSSMEGVLYLEKEKVYSDYSRKIKNLFDEAENLVSKIKEEKINNKRAVINEIANIQRELNNHGSQKLIPKEREEIYEHMTAISIDEIKVPMTVFSLTLRKNVNAIATNYRKKEVQIQNGPISLWVSSSTLRYPSGAKPPMKKVSIHIDRVVNGDIEIDCRGMRLEEFQKASERAIDEVINGEIPFLTIIHGHGDGVLKSWLRNYLNKRHRDVKWENIEGNDGCTKITLS